MIAQNQHYVPKFILRHFLSDEAKEQVCVYDKHMDKQFVTSIRNVMAERRFNDFVFDDDWIVSFEPIACGIEDMLVPRYKTIVAERRLEGSLEERADLAFLIAFQMLRSKSSREMFASLEKQLSQKVTAMGGRMEDVKGWEPPTEDLLKKVHLASMKESIGEFAHIIAQKDFLLAEATDKRQFYLGDSPVALHNRKSFAPYGNLGLALPGIEIYMPLSSDLMLCTWCPSLIPETEELVEKARAHIQRLLLNEVMAGRITAPQMKRRLESPEFGLMDANRLATSLKTGLPLKSNDDTMDFYNSRQMAFAHRYVISKEADFELARRHNREFPQLRRGRQFTMS